MFLHPSPWLAAHLAAAIRAHRDTMRRQHHPVPDELTDLEAALVDRVRQAQSGPPDDGMPDLPDDGPMLLLTYEQVAGLLAVSRSTVKRLVSDGTLTPVDVAGARRLHRDDVERLARQGTT
jgi:excisionase family DNA binding protein